MAFKSWTYLELPTPLRIGTGMFDAWRDDCRRAWQIERIATDPADSVVLQMHVPSDLDTSVTLTAMAWVDKLVREEMLAPGVIIFEYALKRNCPLPGKMTVSLSVDGPLKSALAAIVKADIDAEEAA